MARECQLLAVQVAAWYPVTHFLLLWLNKFSKRKHGAKCYSTQQRNDR